MFHDGRRLVELVLSQAISPQEAVRRSGRTDGRTVRRSGSPSPRWRPRARSAGFLGPVDDPGRHGRL